MDKVAACTWIWLKGQPFHEAYKMHNSSQPIIPNTSAISNVLHVVHLLNVLLSYRNFSIFISVLSAGKFSLTFAWVKRTMLFVLVRFWNVCHWSKAFVNTAKVKTLKNVSKCFHCETWPCLSKCALSFLFFFFNIKHIWTPIISRIWDWFGLLPFVISLSGGGVIPDAVVPISPPAVLR